MISFNSETKIAAPVNCAKCGQKLLILPLANIIPIFYFLKLFVSLKLITLGRRVLCRFTFQLLDLNFPGLIANTILLPLVIIKVLLPQVTGLPKLKLTIASGFA